MCVCDFYMIFHSIFWFSHIICGQQWQKVQIQTEKIGLLYRLLQLFSSLSLSLTHLLRVTYAPKTILMCICYVFLCFFFCSRDFIGTQFSKLVTFFMLLNFRMRENYIKLHENIGSCDFFWNSPFKTHTKSAKMLKNTPFFLVLSISLSFSLGMFVYICFLLLFVALYIWDNIIIFCYGRTGEI